MMQPNFGATVTDYDAYRIPYAPQLFERLKGYGVGNIDQSILDIGAGTGLLGDALEQQGCRVTMVERSESLLRCSAGRRRIVGVAEALPFSANTFEAVLAGGCWHWFNRQAAPMELLRVLTPGGLLAVIYQTYVPMPGSVAEATECLILDHRPGWRHANSTGINGQVLRDMQINGFEKIESFSFDVEVRFSQQAWRGYIRSTSPVGASMSPAQMAAFDERHRVLLRDWPQMLSVPHRVFAAIARKPELAL
jgi:SAM-dependent methyltransferase